MQHDLSAYLHHLDGMDASVEQKLDLIAVLYRIAEAAIDIALGTDPTQACLVDKSNKRFR
ncbi:hypothetical protein [Stakelama tenebrarum]|uniref:Uncharacterized protein n=1 Tax=Stakelama tenebrarum TaxID=2711215 RepID=A0A6G6Y4V5_9SPHN|nr:hypothetical protein [Sphingosinithalassobacter tenebrarum]QIG79435.1 hypothetical protein G5C33_06300 [Sphingosinithalassobacter tenebrarum]QIG79929.1 hypothetical protein G5C33_09155 [Sphingosinithalassobacter tenebrarum]